MECKQLTDKLSVRGQITPEDMAAIKAQGFDTIICNRPDGEGADQPCAADIEAAAKEAGISFHYNPMEQGGVSPEAVHKQGELLIDNDGKVLAYCGSGKRATVLWALSNPQDLDAEERVKRAAEAGHDISMLRPHL